MGSNKQQYNATVAKVLEVHEALRIFRIRPDAGPLTFVPGQFTVLGLEDWEPSVVADKKSVTRSCGKLIKRAYSISSSILNERGELEPPASAPYTEFYITLVPATPEHAAGLTPRLFSLKTGDRLYVGPRAKGHYTIAPVRPTDTVVFAATGTGEAPHNAMLAELLARGHASPIVSLVCVRRCRDLGYPNVHRRLEQRFANYRYMPLTTREPKNVESGVAGFVGKQYLQDYFESRAIDEIVGGRLDPHRTRVYLCGNPLMLGLPERTTAGLAYPAPKGMAEVLAGRGFALDDAGRPGNVHFEKYW